MWPSSQQVHRARPSKVDGKLRLARCRNSTAPAMGVTEAISKRTQTFHHGGAATEDLFEHRLGVLGWLKI